MTTMAEARRKLLEAKEEVEALKEDGVRAALADLIDDPIREAYEISLKRLRDACVAYIEANNKEGTFYK